MEPHYNLERAYNTTACAISSGKVDLVRFFLSKGAKPTGRYLQSEDTYLGAAARLPLYGRLFNAAKSIMQNVS